MLKTPSWPGSNLATDGSLLFCLLFIYPLMALLSRRIRHLLWLNLIVIWCKKQSTDPFWALPSWLLARRTLVFLSLALSPWTQRTATATHWNPPNVPQKRCCVSVCCSWTFTRLPADCPLWICARPAARCERTCTMTDSLHQSGGDCCSVCLGGALTVCPGCQMFFDLLYLQNKSFFCLSFVAPLM